MDRRYIAGPAGQYQYQTDCLDNNSSNQLSNTLGGNNENKRNHLNSVSKKFIET